MSPNPLPKKSRLTPASERHDWLNKHLLSGQSTSCNRCSCAKALTRDRQTRYRLVGACSDTPTRPACTGGLPATVSAPQKPPQEPRSPADPSSPTPAPNEAPVAPQTTPPAPYCDGKCGVCLCISSPLAAAATK